MLYIRHGEKTHPNDSTIEQGFDPPLTEEGKREAYDFFTNLMATIDTPPPLLVTSPYLRARETAVIAQECLSQRWGHVPLTIDPLIGEYLGHQIKVNSSHFHPDTWKHQPVIEHKWSQYLKRINRHMNTTEPGWYITHGLVMVGIAHRCGERIKYPGYLGSYVRRIEK